MNTNEFMRRGGWLVAMAMATGCHSMSQPEQNPDAAMLPPKITSATRFDFSTVDGPGGGVTTINGMNRLGELVGFTTTTDAAGDDVNSNFVRHKDGSFTSVAVGDPAGSANALNGAGTVVGVANDAALVISNGTPKMLAPFGASESVAFGINDDGVIVGQYTQDANTMPGFIDKMGVFTKLNPTPSTTMTFIAAITNSGLATGFYSEDGTTQHGFTYDTAMSKLALLADPSTPRTAASPIVLTQFLTLNTQEQLAGYYQTTDGSQYGFVYDLASETYIFLDAPLAAPVAGVQITQITGIDDADELTGFYIDAAGNQHGFIALPK